MDGEVELSALSGRVRKLQGQRPAIPAQLGNRPGGVVHEAPLREVLANCHRSTVEVSSLTLGTGMRTASDPAHVAVLAEVADSLPPVLVHGPSGRVLDGAHRVQAAKLAGRTTVPALIYNGRFEDGFIVAVWINAKQGLPLSREDRVSATTKIIQSHESWSDRMIAGVAGVSPATVRALRRSVAGELPRDSSRTGRDGKLRPVDASVGRERAGELWRSNPGSTVREIARRAGISPATALDVRNRLRAGLSATPGRDPADSSPPAREWTPVENPPNALLSGSARRDGIEETSRLNASLERLMRDPSMRQTVAGRELLRLLDLTKNTLLDHDRISDVPDHCAWSVCDLARMCAELWEGLASQLEVCKPGIR